MPFGTIKTKQSKGGIPLCSPPYAVVEDTFSDLELLTIRYHTTYDAVKDLVPEELELEDEPLISTFLYKYGFGPVCAYNEFVISVAVKYNGNPYLFTIMLVLNNEAAIFSGRERLGIPKVWGNVHFTPSEVDPASPPTGYVTGYVERPVGSKLIQFGFRPRLKVQDVGPVQRSTAPSLHLKCIPASDQTSPPVVREFISTRAEITKAEIWKGDGSIGLFNVSEFEPLHKLHVVRYVDATLFRHANFKLHEPHETFNLL